MKLTEHRLIVLQGIAAVPMLFTDCVCTRTEPVLDSQTTSFTLGAYFLLRTPVMLGSRHPNDLRIFAGKPG